MRGRAARSPRGSPSAAHSTSRPRNTEWRRRSPDFLAMRSRTPLSVKFWRKHLIGCGVRRRWGVPTGWIFECSRDQQNEQLSSVRWQMGAPRDSSNDQRSLWAQRIAGIIARRSWTGQLGGRLSKNLGPHPQLERGQTGHSFRVASRGPQHDRGGFSLGANRCCMR